MPAGASFEETSWVLADAFWDFYETEPIEKITVTQVAQRAGVNRLTFYRHFEDCHALARWVGDRMIEGVRASYDSVFGLENVEAMDGGSIMKFLDAFFMDNIRYLRVLLGPHGDRTFRERLAKMLCAMYSEAVAGAGYAIDCPHEQRLLAFCVDCGISAYMPLCEEPPDIRTSTELLSLVSELFFNRILPTFERM